MSLGRLLPHARGLTFESLREGFPSRWESVGFFPIDVSIRGWQGLPSGPLNRFLTLRDITREGFSIQSKVVDLMTNGTWNWPLSWLAKAPNLMSIAAPTLVNQNDLVEKTQDMLRPWDVGPSIDISSLRSIPTDDHVADFHYIWMMQRDIWNGSIKAYVWLVEIGMKWPERSSPKKMKKSKMPKGNNFPRVLELVEA
ncbi:hypothetical protein Tco_0481425 [Tanacetum coccineum]